MAATVTVAARWRHGGRRRRPGIATPSPPSSPCPLARPASPSAACAAAPGWPQRAGRSNRRWPAPGEPRLSGSAVNVRAWRGRARNRKEDERNGPGDSNEALPFTLPRPCPAQRLASPVPVPEGPAPLQKGPRFAQKAANHRPVHLRGQPGPLPRPPAGGARRGTLLLRANGGRRGPHIAAARRCPPRRFSAAPSHTRGATVQP